MPRRVLMPFLLDGIRVFYSCHGPDGKRDAYKPGQFHLSKHETDAMEMPLFIVGRKSLRYQQRSSALAPGFCGSRIAE
jgi:hypothetical protein